MNLQREDDVFSSVFNEWSKDSVLNWHSISREHNTNFYLADSSLNSNTFVNTPKSEYNNHDLFKNINLSHIILSNTTTSPTTFSTTTMNNYSSSDSSLYNCTGTDLRIYKELRNSYGDLIALINLFIYITILIGILFNILNLIVLLKSKLNESPYTYLTMLALSDLGALSMIAFEKARQLLPQTPLVERIHLYVIIVMINVFLSSSMYVTLALTIERFIFVHSPFKAMSICRRSIARKICVLIFMFSLLRSLYLPFMYKKNCFSGHEQRKIKFLDVYEFLISLALPYLTIFIANISLIFSLNKQNQLMSCSSVTSISCANLKLRNRLLLLQNGGGGQRNNSESLIGPQEAVIPIYSSSSKSSSSMYHRTSNLREIRNQKKLTITLIIILCLLLVCYLPSFLFEESLADAIFGSHDELLTQTTNKRDNLNGHAIRAFKIKAIGNRISILLIYLNCSSNFLIYCICNKKFKNSLKLLMKNSTLNAKLQRLIYLTKTNCTNLSVFKKKSHLSENQINEAVPITPSALSTLSSSSPIRNSSFFRFNFEWRKKQKFRNRRNSSSACTINTMANNNNVRMSETMSFNVLKQNNLEFYFCSKIFFTFRFFSSFSLLVFKKIYTFCVKIAL